MYTVFGAGSVGTVLASLLAEGERPVRIAGRNAVSELRAEGDDETVRVRVPVTTDPEGTILLCVQEPEVENVCAAWPEREVVTFQNGVASEEVAARHCRVIGGVWRMTCTLVEPGRARFTRRGRVVIGRPPEGEDSAVRAIASDLCAVGLDVGVSTRIGRDKWLKLFVNLTSAPNALVRPGDHDLPEFGALKAALLEEAREVFAAAHIEAASCDGRDASMEREIELQRAGGGRKRPIHNATWRRLSRGLPVVERFHDTLVRLAADHGREASRNASMLRLLERARGPECYGAAEALAEVVG
jgi:ketopantoate reductase